MADVYVRADRDYGLATTPKNTLSNKDPGIAITWL